ncbi:hypothetical protein LXL04_017433 [Taraxacum kok-saghyz]
MSFVVEKKLEAMRNNFFIGGDVEERKMTWVAWRRRLADKEYGEPIPDHIYRIYMTETYDTLCMMSITVLYRVGLRQLYHNLMGPILSYMWIFSTSFMKMDLCYAL